MDAEIDIDVSLVRRLVSTQHPDLLGTIRFFDNGWDNALFRLGDNHLVRLPRREAAAGLAAHEQRWLPEIAHRLDVAVPVPERVGHPDAGFPWHWSIVPWFDGTVLGSTNRGGDGLLADDLARFLGHLHAPAPSGAPVNPVRGVPLSRRDAAMRRRLGSGILPRSDDLTVLWSQAVATPDWFGPPLWLHGDLHPMNIVLAADGGLGAVLDFGDLCSGDPATDLAVAWLAFAAGERAGFRTQVDAKNRHNPDTWRRAQGWALVLASAIIEGSAQDSPMLGFAHRALAEVLSDA